jgi:putative oxidoreductase
MTTTRMTAQPAPAADMAGLRSRLVAAQAALGRIPGSLFQLLFRLGIASVFLKAGLNKLSSWEVTLQLFRDEYRVPVLPPEVAATLATSFELGCSILLVLGLATRIATLPLFGMLATIQLFVYPDAWSEHLVWGSMLAFLLARGPGAISVDRLLGLERLSRE